MEYVYRNRLLEDWRNSKNMGYHLMTVPIESKCGHGMTKKERKKLCGKHVSTWDAPRSILFRWLENSVIEIVNVETIPFILTI